MDSSLVDHPTGQTGLVFLQRESDSFMTHHLLSLSLTATRVDFRWSLSCNTAQRARSRLTLSTYARRSPQNKTRPGRFLCTRESDVTATSYSYPSNTRCYHKIKPYKY